MVGIFISVIVVGLISLLAIGSEAPSTIPALSLTAPADRAPAPPPNSVVAGGTPDDPPGRPGSAMATSACVGAMPGGAAPTQTTS